MATPFMTAAQMGSYFVAQYYQMLQQRPELVHQLYSDASTILRIDGNTRETATAMLQIHALVMSLCFTTIEIKTAHSLESWNGGVIVMVAGSVQIRNLTGRKKFVQTFFLAPQEKGYFVLNDIFQLIDEQHIPPYPPSFLVQNDLNAKLNGSPTIPQPVPNYVMGGGLQSTEYMAPVDVKENGSVDEHLLPEQRMRQVPDAEDILQDNSGEPANGFLEGSTSEPQKHTYASILRVAKGHPGTSVVPAPSSNVNMALASDWHHTSQRNQQATFQQPQQSSTALVANDSLEVKAAEEVSTDFRGEIKSVYVRNLPTTVSPVEIEQEFKKFGRLKPAGVAIRRLKDTDICYAFVEFEDITAVHDAIKAATVEIAGQQIYIEERRPNSRFSRGRRGRGRGNYQPDTLRGHFGSRSFSWGGRQGRGKREYNRPRGNGYYHQATRQEDGCSGGQVSQNGQVTFESSA